MFCSSLNGVILDDKYLILLNYRAIEEFTGEVKNENLVSHESGRVKSFAAGRLQSRRFDRYLLVRANKNVTLLEKVVSWLCCIESS